MPKLESQHIEWKVNWRDDYLRWVSGFANAQGGRLEIGKNDVGEVLGVPDARKLLEDLPNKIRDLLGIVVDVNLHESAGRAWLAIVVQPYVNPISYRGHYYMRSGSTLQGLKGASLPQAALREALLNALVHRDYAVGAPVQIKVCDDHLKIWNPAVLPEGWTLAKLLGEHASSPFNPATANVFFRAGEIEAWGRGVQRIFEACSAAGAPEPLLRHEPNDLWLEFPFSATCLKALGGERAASAHDTEQVTPERLEPRLESNLAAKVMVLLGKAEAGKAHLAKLLGHKSVSGELHKQIRRLLTLELIEMTLPDKPNSRLQKYRLTAIGRSYLALTEPISERSDK